MKICGNCKYWTRDFKDLGYCNKAEEYLFFDRCTYLLWRESFNCKFWEKKENNNNTK